MGKNSMPFSSGHPSGTFLIGWTQSPQYDFGIFARGYRNAANILSEALLAKPRFSEYEAYPVVFLYRHAFELGLKNVIFKAARLCAFRRMDDIDGKAYDTHSLRPLADIVRRVLYKLFPKSSDLRKTARNLVKLADELSKIDYSSYVYRYPTGKQGKPSIESQQEVNLIALSTSVDEALEELELIDFGLDIETDLAQEICEIMEEQRAAWT
jgi:hypothetical protein